jgi:hypothetical protein
LIDYAFAKALLPINLKPSYDPASFERTAVQAKAEKLSIVSPEAFTGRNGSGRGISRFSPRITSSSPKESPFVSKAPDSFPHTAQPLSNIPIAPSLSSAGAGVGAQEYSKPPPFPSSYYSKPVVDMGK